MSRLVSGAPSDQPGIAVRATATVRGSLTATKRRLGRSKPSHTVCPCEGSHARVGDRRLAVDIDEADVPEDGGRPLQFDNWCVGISQILHRDFLRPSPGDSEEPAIRTERDCLGKIRRDSGDSNHATVIHSSDRDLAFSGRKLEFAASRGPILQRARGERMTVGADGDRLDGSPVRAPRIEPSVDLEVGRWSSVRAIPFSRPMTTLPPSRTNGHRIDRGLCPWHVKFIQQRRWVSPGPDSKRSRRVIALPSQDPSCKLRRFLCDHTVVIDKCPARLTWGFVSE